MPSESTQIKVGVVLNYISMGLGAIIPLLYTPVMLQLLGQDEYGLYKLAASVTSYLGLLSMGMGTAVSRYLIKARVEEGQDAEERFLGLFMAIYAVVAMATLVVGTVIVMNLGIWYSDSLGSDGLVKMKILVFIMVCSTALSFLVSPYMACVVTHERFIFQQLMGLILTVLAPIINIIVLFMGYASIGMATSSLALNIIVQLLYIVYIRKSIGVKPRFRGMPTRELKGVFIFSFWIFVANVVNQLYAATDVTMMGAVGSLGTAAVAVYSIGAVFQSMTSNLTTGIGGLLNTRTTKLVFAGASNTELTDYSIRYGRLQEYVAVLITSGFVVFGQPFIHYYIGDDYLVAYWIALPLMIPNLIPLAQSVCLNIIVAQNKHRFRSLTYLGIAIANVIGTWFLMNTPLGPVGAALATGLALLAGQGFVMNWYYSRRIGLEIGRFWKEVGQLFIVPCILCAVFLLLGCFVDFYKLYFLAAGIIAYTAIYILLSWIFIMTDYEKNLFKSFFKVFHRKGNDANANGEENSQVA